MKRYFLLITIALFASTLTTSLYSQSTKITISPDIELYKIADSVFVHVTYDESPNYGRFSSNGMLIIKNGEALLIDTPMDTLKTSLLYRYVKDSLHTTIKLMIAGHFHDDCIGGLPFLKQRGVDCIANTKTIGKCKELGLPMPTIPFTDTLHLNFNNINVDCYYPGAGHTIDNIVVWLSDYKILFGGCLVKSLGAKTLGNLTDAYPQLWKATIDNVIEKYNSINIVIPGHGAWGDKELLNYTKKLIDS